VNADPTWQPPRRRPAGDRRNLNVYLPDSLRARMDRVPAKINWSAVCQRAIETALEVLEAAKPRTPRDGGSDASTVPFSYSD
jgi:post-segregation antitoxin (ccd killing protein)